jgi:hypothetical protein
MQNLQPLTTSDIVAELTAAIKDIEAIHEKLKFLKTDETKLVNLWDGLDNLYWAVHDLT